MFRFIKYKTSCQFNRVNLNLVWTADFQISLNIAIKLHFLFQFFQKIFNDYSLFIPTLQNFIPHFRPTICISFEITVWTN